jgi:hypothetical protein
MSKRLKNADASSSSVGYGKPPNGTQFKPGKSGNPKGRPKGARNLDTLMAEELESLIKVREQGVEHTVSKGHAVLKALVAKGMQGDVRAAAAIIEWNDRQKALKPDADEQLDETDEAILERAMARSSEK